MPAPTLRPLSICGTFGANTRHQTTALSTPYAPAYSTSVSTSASIRYSDLSYEPNLLQLTKFLYAQRTPPLYTYILDATLLTHRVAIRL
jgi:hypothetical protein